MRVIIAGSRDYHGIPSQIQEFVDESGFAITEVVCGCARGADTAGKTWAESKGVRVEKFPAKWDEYGKGAGFIRNQEMADYADALIAIKTHDDSRGTNDMIRRAINKGIPVYITEIHRRK